MIKKILKITGLVVLTLLCLAFLIPVLFKKQITALVKKEINKNLNAKVDFTDVKLSLFKHFPQVGIIVKDLTIVGTEEFEKDTLIAVRKVDAAAGLFSVLKGKNIKVSSVDLEFPRIHALVNQSGKANWDIVKETGKGDQATDTSASAFRMTLKRYQISDGYLLYRDEKAGTFTELKGLKHVGSGDLTADVFTLATATHAESASFTQDNIPYLINTKTDINTGIKIDNKTNTYTFKTDDIVLNNLKLSTEGFIQMVNDSNFNMDIKFQSPSNDFKDILSMIPDMYKKDFEKIKTNGKAVFNGFVKGTYTPQQMPAYDVQIQVTDGSFQYPDLPKPVKNIQLAARISNVDGLPDHAEIDISKGHVEMDNEPFDFRFTFKNPVTTQLIEAHAKGKLDLSQISKFIKLEPGTKLAGLLWADAFVKGPMKAIQAQSGAFAAGGFFDIQNFFYSDSHFPQPIKNGNIKATLENSGGIADRTVINVSSGHIEVGNDPIDFTLQLRNPVSTIDFSGKAKGKFTLDNVRQFVKLDPGTSIGGQLNADLDFAGNKTAIDQKQYDRITLNGTAGVSSLKYKSKDYPTGVDIASTQLLFNQKKVTLANLDGSYLQSHFTANGELNNLIGYVMQDQSLAGNLNVSVDKMNLNDWIGQEDASSTAAASSNSTTSATPFLVPSGINFTIHAKAGDVKYDKVNYSDVQGTMTMNDETIKLQNVKTNALEGSLVMNGSYSTKTNKKEPVMSLDYVVTNMDVQKVFYAFNTIQKLMPIGQFLDGKLNSQLSVYGNLNGNMMPLLSSLTGKGNLLLLQGVLKKFGPLEKLGALLQIDHLKSITLKDIKNYIEFAQGKVLVKPFTIHVNEIEMQIGGIHGLDQSIDYAIQMKVPRKYMGSGGNELVNNLVTQATAKGFALKLGDVVNLNIRMTGSFSNPSFKIDLKEMAGDIVKNLEQQAIDFLKQKMDSAKGRTKDTLSNAKTGVIDDIKKDVKEKIFGKDTSKTDKPDSAEKKTSEKVKNKIKDIFRKPKPVPDTTKKNP